MANGGKCNKCGGDDHMRKYCPSTTDSSGKVAGEEQCYGCNGKGHRKADCPTANPHLKGEGKGYGGGNNNWPKGGGKDMAGASQKENEERDTEEKDTVEKDMAAKEKEAKAREAYMT